MEKLICVPNFPLIRAISSISISAFDRSCRILFIDFNKSSNEIFLPNIEPSHEIYFSNVFDCRYAIEDAFFIRKFDSEDRPEEYSVFYVGNSDYVRRFINDTDGIYGDIYGENRLHHYIIFDSVDTGIELIATESPKLKIIGKIKVL